MAEQHRDLHDCLRLRFVTSVFDRILQVDWPIRRFDILDSTNVKALEFAGSGDCGPCWIVARTQSAGRGRMGREWLSREGNLYATALFPFDLPLDIAPQISFCAGLAVRDACRAAGLDVTDLKLKWPNDVRWKKQKVCGILVESTRAVGDASFAMACGIGVNVAAAPQVEQATTCINEIGGAENETAEEFVLRLNLALVGRLRQWRNEGFEAIRRDWEDAAEGMGEQIAVRVNDTSETGILEGMDAEGALLLRCDSGELLKITAGDVRLMD